VLIQIILFTLLGISFGIITGAIPGIHINLITTILLTSALEITNYIENIYLLIVICSLSITHTFIDFIPSVFLGCPNTENSLLPGHELLKKGRGPQAVFLSSIGSLIGILLISILAFPLIYVIPKINNLLGEKIVYLLIFLLVFLLLKEKNKIKSLAAIIFSGSLGLIVLNLELNEPLLPMLTGLFGAPLIIQSLKEKTIIPLQEKIFYKPKKILKPTFLATISSIICGFLPGLGTSQAAIISTNICKTNKEEFITLIGATNTLVLIISFIALYSIQKIRTGVAASINTLFPEFSWKILVLIIIICLISGVISFFITIILTKFISNRINKINYQKISLTTLIILLIINLIVGKTIGMLILIISTTVGIYVNKLEVKKSNMMACILIPTIYFYLTN
jgi:putative membrane protein